MIVCANDLKLKEVINIKDGSRLGYVDDLEIDTCTATVISIVVYGKLRFLGIFGRCDDTIIRWEDIKVIGEDAVLVKMNECNTVNHKKRRFFAKLFS